MIVAHISQLELSNLEDSGRAQVTLEPAQEGVVSHSLVFEAEVTELRQALTEQHNRHVQATADMRMALQELLYAWEQDHSKEDGVAVDARAALDTSTTRAPAHLHMNATEVQTRQDEHEAMWQRVSTTVREAQIVAGGQWEFVRHFNASVLRTPEIARLYADEAYDARGLTLLTDDQAVMTLERIKESRRLSYVAAIYSGIKE